MCVYVDMYIVQSKSIFLIDIMVCAGPWCPKLVEPLGLKLPLKACDMWTQHDFLSPWFSNLC